MRLKNSNSNSNSNFLLLCTNNPNKNIKILNKIIPILKEKIPSINFFITISNEDYKNIINKDFMEYVTNLEPLNVTECIEAYKNTDFLFLPTLLETFTATYPEAMIMKKPILTSDLSFARDLCGDAAVYFDPLSPKDISDKIINLVNNKSKIDELISRGEIRVKNFPSAKDRAKEILKLCTTKN
jgi:glycosyltransferase involved in cell wall biosynthesis